MVGTYNDFKIVGISIPFLCSNFQSTSLAESAFGEPSQIGHHMCKPLSWAFRVGVDLNAGHFPPFFPLQFSLTFLLELLRAVPGQRADGAAHVGARVRLLASGIGAAPGPRG